VTAKSTNVGKQTEQAVARWLRDHGFPHAERTVRTGYKATGRELSDRGDIDGCPGLVVQCKSLRPADRAERAVEGWLTETEIQRQATSAEIGLLIVRRWGTTDVGRWWAFLRAGVLGGVQASGEPLAPVRLEVRHAVGLLRSWGYGESIFQDGAA
jgi:hypothetical protein